MKLVSPKYLGNIIHLGIIHLNTIHWQVCVCMYIYIYIYKIYFDHSTSALESTLIYLKCMVNEHLFMNLVPLSIYFNPR